MPTHPNIDDPAVRAQFADRYRRDGLTDTEIEARLAALPDLWRRHGFTPEAGSSAASGPASALDQLRASSAGVRADHLAATQDWNVTKRTLQGKTSAVSAPLTPAELTPAGLAKLAKEDPDRMNANWSQVAPILADRAAKKGATK